MKKSLTFVGCGLLVLALSLSVGCKSKKSGGTDGGTDSGMTGTGGSGTAGKGGNGGGGKGGAGGSGATLTTAECTSMTATAGVPMTCAQCGCTKNLTQATACLKDANCWKLINCAVTMCGGNDTACITQKCVSFLGGATAATPFGMTLSSMCTTECAASTTTDAGSGDAGH